MRAILTWRKRQGGAGAIRLRMAPMIDVVFLLLVFFLLVVNFRSKEGYLPSELPRRMVRTVMMEVEPLVIEIAGDGVVCVGGGEGVGITDVAGVLRGVLEEEGRTVSDPVKLVPRGETAWETVVQVYDVLVGMELRNVIFSSSKL